MWHSVLRIIALLLFLSLGTNGLHVQLFKDFNFRGLIYDHTSGDPECHNVKAYAQGVIGSLTSDTCLMLYSQNGCDGDSFKVSRDMTEELKNLNKPVYSFMPCNEQFGGSKIHVQMFNSGNGLIGEYKDICSCQDLPSQITTNLHSLNNFGNCLRVYPTDSCTGSYAEIPAGRNGVSQNLPNLGWYVRSVSGCNRRACAKLHASIFKIVILPDSKRTSVMSSSQEVDLATKTTFYNNGSATVFQEYEARRKVRDSTTIETSKTITNMESHKVENGTTKSWGVDISIPGILEVGVKVANGIEKGYTTEKTESEKETNTFTHEEESEFNVKQVIEVPPCVQYEVSSTVQVTENFPMRYEIHSKIYGEASGKKLTAEEVSEQIDDMTWVENLDEYTAVFKSTHSAVANVGVEAHISGEGKPIPGCRREE